MKNWRRRCSCYCFIEKMSARGVMSSLPPVFQHPANNFQGPPMSFKLQMGVLLLKFLLYHIPFFLFMWYLWVTETFIPNHYADLLYVLPLSMTAVEAIPWNKCTHPKNLKYILPLRVSFPFRLVFVYIVQICHIHVLTSFFQVGGTKSSLSGGGPWHLFGASTSKTSSEDSIIATEQNSESRPSKKALGGMMKKTTSQQERQDGTAPTSDSSGPLQDSTANKNGNGPGNNKEIIPLPGEDPVPATPKLKTMSVILPCAGEGEYAFKTARSIFQSWDIAKGDDENDDHPTLHEIIVVDDGTQPKLADTHLPEQVTKDYRIKIVRNDRTVGLINAKKIGGDHATGDILTFFDCHVAPQNDWYVHFFEKINENYKRIVVPSITALDLNTWSQQGRHEAGVAKCYLTFDADFKWFNSDDDYVPLLSGGLLSMSKRWWEETGGYDEFMKGWGGENIDQSLRTWLCGGEMITLPHVQVAHMWRVHSDPRTQRKYSVPGNSVTVNRFRAAKAWMGEYAQKMENEFGYGRGQRGSNWYGDLANLLSVKQKNNCREFGWYLNRFRHVYIDGGLIPEHTFLIEQVFNENGKVAGAAQESSSSTKINQKKKLCLTYLRGSGTSSDGNGEVGFKDCDPRNDRQRWHLANYRKGLRAWNTDQCLVDRGQNKFQTYICDISGRDISENFKFFPDSRYGSREAWAEKPVLEMENTVGQMVMGMGEATCVNQFGARYSCKSDVNPVFRLRDFKVPLERELFVKQGFA
ncbi:unnamed protein product [Amoebophrya sp. A120]|nr:unnamed protein product [Amoebophrya sp. A120]|eukprot:GSA120T00008307001.1